ncbi:MAG: WecB/TagA/CpsF family glycosyltransferase, partial [Woeseia sp.]
MQYFSESWSPHGLPRAMKMPEAYRAIKALLERQYKGGIKGRAMDAQVAAVLNSIDTAPDSSQVFAATLSHLAKGAGKNIPCEQTPRNIYYAEALLDSFPDARIVHVLRDPRAVMASQKSRWRKRSLMSEPARMSRLQQLRTWANYHPYIVAWLWSRATTEALRLESHPRFHTLRFEDLITAPEQCIRDLCAFLDVGYESAMLTVEHVNSSYVVSTGHATGFSQTPIESWRSALTRNEIALISNRCGELMEAVRYPTAATRIPRQADAAFKLSLWLHLAGAAILNPRRVLIQSRAWPISNSSPRLHEPQSGQVDTRDREKPGSMPSHSLTKRVFGLACMDTSLDGAAEHLVDCARSGVSRQVAFVNAHCLNASVDDPGLQQALRRADILFADGIGMQLASRFHGQRLRYNVNGTDLFPLICERASDEKLVIGLLGGTAGISAQCEQVLNRNYPALRIGYVQHGYSKPGTDDALVTAINDAGIHMLFVAMGVPLQERWVLEHAERLQVPVVLSVGGLFDFVSGSVPRAPLFVRKLRMEWLFRLCVEPRRLFRRYVVGNPVFLFRAMRYAFTGRFWSAEKSVVAGGAS